MRAEGKNAPKDFWRMAKGNKGCGQGRGIWGGRALQIEVSMGKSSVTKPRGLRKRG